MNEKTNRSIDNLKRALARLKEAIDVHDSDASSLSVDGTIQRFEFCIELFWKMLRRTLLEYGVESNTPREAIQKAYQAKWIDDEALWIQMLQDRNRTSHVYEEESALEIFNRIPNYYAVMTDALRQIEQRIPE